MFDNNISFNNILTSLESTLSIEMSSNMKVMDIIQAAKDRLENTYACKLDKDVFAIQSESQLMADNMTILLRDVEQCLKSISFYLYLKVFHTNMGITLSDVNYLGYDKESLLTALSYLMYSQTYTAHSQEIMSSFYDTLNNINMCSVKRLFISMIMLYELGISEGVGVIAHFLYTGGLVV